MLQADHRRMATPILVFSLVVTLSFWNLVVFASEPAPLQDFCVADLTNGARVNGLTCKNPTLVKAEDFFYNGLNITANTTNSYGYNVTPVTVYQLPGLNTLGLSLIRIDYALWGTNPPHTHPRASEILMVLEGTLQVGFITSDPENRLITKVLHRGQVFVFPIGLIHFQRNVGHEKAVAIAALSSQNPGVIGITNTVFGSTPPLAPEILAQAFQLDYKTVKQMQRKF